MTPHLAGTPVLESERLVLRAPAPQDWETCRAFLKDDRSHFLRDDKAFDDLNIWRGFCHLIGMWVVRGFGVFAFCRKGTDEVLGIAGPWLPEGWPEPEIAWSVWVAEAEGKGFAFEAASRTLVFAREELGLMSPVSYIDPGNTRSIALAERLGAVLDPDAPPYGDDPCLVYRHPAPEAGA